MPSRDKELAPLIRGVFLPEEGEVWAKPDISQQEFRFVVHYAVLHKLPGAKEAAERYRTDPDTDFHAWSRDMTGLERENGEESELRQDIRRWRAQVRGDDRQAASTKRRRSTSNTIANCRSISRSPPSASDEAKRLGYTELYDGARRHWNNWAPGGHLAKGAGPCAREEASAASTIPIIRGIGSGCRARRDPHRAERADSRLGGAAHQTVDAGLLARGHRPAAADARRA